MARGCFHAPSFSGTKRLNSKSYDCHMIKQNGCCTMKLSQLLVFAVSALISCHHVYFVVGLGSTKPNIIFILTDDQDVALGGQVVYLQL